MVWVAKAGGDFTTVTAALNAIGTTLPAATTTNRYVIRIAPGTYVEPAGILLENFVDIEGSGQANTFINANSTATDNTTVRAAAGELIAEIRNLTISNSGDISIGAIALRIIGVTPVGGFRVTNVTASVLNGGNGNTYGIYIQGSSPILTGVTANVSSFGSETAITNVNANTTMHNVTATASGGFGLNIGIDNQGSSAPSMNDVTAIVTSASGTASNFGVSNSGTASPSMNDVTATAVNGGSNFGVSHDGTGIATMTNVTASGSFGVAVSNGTVLIRDSFIAGSVNSIFRAGGVVRVGSTQLQGPVSGAMTCVDVYNVSFMALGTNCT